MIVLFPTLVALAVSSILTRVLVGVSPRLGLVDVPNERSLHTVPVATVGGLGVLAGAFSGIGLYLNGSDASGDTLGLVVGSAALLLLIYDEIRPLPWVAKLVLQSAAIGVVVAWSAGIPPGAAAVLILLLTMNFYNFMDGLDGFSGIVGCVGAVFLYLLFYEIDPVLSNVSLLVSAAALGFVVWNLPPARIFMGDVGSHFLGLFFGWAALEGRAHGIPIYVSLLAIGPFVFDAGYTLIRRAIRRENITQAHRFHLYQRLTRSGWSAGRVDLLYGGWTVLCGVVALRFAERGLVGEGVGALILSAVTVVTLVEMRWARLEAPG